MPANAVLVGLCTGLLAAAALSASQSALELIGNALHIVRVAFRIGIKVNNTARRLSVEVNQRWSRLVLGAQKEASIAEIRQFNKIKVRIVSEIAFYLPTSPSPSPSPGPCSPTLLFLFWFRDTPRSERRPGKVPVKGGRHTEAIVRTWGGEA